MAAVIYRCPNTGFRIQGYTLDEAISRDHDAYEPVTCLACKLVHLVNPKSGKVFVAGGISGTARCTNTGSMFMTPRAGSLLHPWSFLPTTTRRRPSKPKRCSMAFAPNCEMVIA